MTLRRAAGLFASLATTFATSLLLSAPTMAQILLPEEVRTVSTGSTPIEKNITVSGGATYHLKLIDLNVGQPDPALTPQPLASAKIAVTAGTTVLATGALTAGTGVAELDFTAPANVTEAVVRIVGKLPGTGKAGNISVEVSTGGNLVNSFLGSINPPPTELPSYRAIVTESITPGAGNFTVEVEDLALPATLPVLTAIVSESGGTVPVGTINVPAGQPSVAFSVSNPTQAYSINIGAESDQAVNAGLYALRVRNSGSGDIVFSRVYTLGTVTQLGTVNLDAGGHTLAFTDFQFPAALARGGVALTINGDSVAKTSGSLDFTTSGGTHQVYAVATAAAGNSGSYGVDVRVQGGASKFSTVKAAGGAPANGVYAYNFIASVPTAGSYRLRLADFNFPGTLSAVSLIAAQNGAKLDGLTGAGSLTLPNVAAGQLTIVVVAKPAVAGGGLIGLDLAPSAGGAKVFEGSQGVGNLSESRPVPAAATANYRVNVTDLKFPAAFTQFSAIVTRGADTNVAIFGSDQFDFAGTPGNYFVNFIAQPNATEGAGTYGLKVTQLPAAPVVTLTANPSEPTAGSTVRVEWSATNAKTCTASGAWSGSKATSGGENSGPITATSTFTLKCEGDGGSTTQSVSVSAVTQSNSGGGGGGALGWLTLAGLALVGGARLSRRRSYI